MLPGGCRCEHNPSMSPVKRPRAPLLIRPVKLPATTPPGLHGDWAPVDTGIDRVEVLPLPDGEAPEDVVVDPVGRVVAGDAGGRIWRWAADPHADAVPELLADTGGRPLGIELDP